MQEDRLLGDIVDFWDKKEKEVKQETTTDKISEMFKTLQDMGYNLDEMGGILESEGSKLILAGAGSGKTTVLILKIIFGLESGQLKKTREVNGLKVETPANILVCTFLKSGAEELRQSFIEWCNRLGVSGIDMRYIHFKTIHAEVYQALQEMGIQINILIETDRMVRSIMKTLKIKSVMNRTGNTTIDEVSDIASLISYLRNRLDNEKYNHPLVGEYSLDKATIESMMAQFKQLKMIEGKMDFEDLQEMLLEGLRSNPKVVEYIQSKYDYVYVDEFQDTSQLQYEILKYYFDGAKKVMCIGDDDQCLVEGTEVETSKGTKNIEDVVVGDKVLAGTGNSGVGYETVDHTTKKRVSEEIIKIRTKTGKEIRGTKDHLSFVRGYTLIDPRIKEKIMKDYREIKGNKAVKVQGLFTEDIYGMVALQDIREGMYIPVLGEKGVEGEEVESVTREDYDGYVYDISIPNTRNYAANGVIVHNCIYSWRGSDIDIINRRFREDYKPDVKQLNTNYRCATNILDAVIPSITQNTNRQEKQLKSHKEGGSVEVVVDGDVTHLLDNIKADLGRGETVGVLARTNADLLIPSMLIELDELEIGYGLSKSVSLAGRIPRQVLSLMDLVTKRYTGEFSEALELFVPRYRQYQVAMFCEILYANKEVNVYNISADDVRYSTPDVYPVIEIIKRHGQEGARGAYIELLTKLETEVYTGDSMYVAKARDFVHYIKRLVNEHPVVQEMSLDEIQVLFRDTLPITMSKRKGLDTKQFLNLSTVHEAKGKEWDNVYIWNNVDGSFPNSVGKRPLTPSEFEEERRVHYIAWTRAKKKLTVYTRSERQGGFLSECNLNGVKITETKGIKSKSGLSRSQETLVFTKKKEQEKKTPMGIFNAYYAKYTSFEWVMKSEGFNLDLCESRVGGKQELFDRLEEKGIFEYPEDMVEEAITAGIESIKNG